MKVAVENAGPCRKQIKVEFTAEEIQKEYDESLAVFAKLGRVKGFRPGKAPMDMIRRMYDKQILEGLHDHLLATGFRQALKEHKLETVAEYDLQKSPLKPDAPFSFSITVEVEPDFELPAYKGIEVEAKKVEVSDDAVAQAIDRYRENAGKYEDLAAPRPVQAGEWQGKDWVILGGLQAGDRVIVDNLMKLRPGAPVAPHPPQAAPVAAPDGKSPPAASPAERKG